MTWGIGIGLAMAALLTAACHSKQNKAADGGPEGSGTHSAVSDTSASQMDAFLDGYYALREAFFRSDTTRADAAARHLDDIASSLSLDRLQGETKKQDSARAALKSLHAAADSLLAEKTLHGKRVQFARISDVAWKLVRTAGVRRKTVYLDLCPMFGEGDGAHWLSATRAIANPYYGHEMPGCGEVTDSLKF